MYYKNYTSSCFAGVGGRGCSWAVVVPSCSLWRYVGNDHVVGGDVISLFTEQLFGRRECFMFAAFEFLASSRTLSSSELCVVSTVPYHPAWLRMVLRVYVDAPNVGRTRALRGDGSQPVIDPKILWAAFESLCDVYLEHPAPEDRTSCFTRADGVRVSIKFVINESTLAFLQREHRGRKYMGRLEGVPHLWLATPNRQDDDPWLLAEAKKHFDRKDSIIILSKDNYDKWLALGEGDYAEVVGRCLVKYVYDEEGCELTLQGADVAKRIARERRRLEKSGVGGGAGQGSRCRERSRSPAAWSPYSSSPVEDELCELMDRNCSLGGAQSRGASSGRGDNSTSGGGGDDAPHGVTAVSTFPDAGKAKTNSMLTGLVSKHARSAS